MTRRPWLGTDPNALFTTSITLNTANCPRNPNGEIPAGTAIGKTAGQHVAYEQHNPAHEFAGLLWNTTTGTDEVRAVIFAGNGIARATINANYLPIKEGPGSLTDPQIKSWINTTVYSGHQSPAKHGSRRPQQPKCSSTVAASS